MNARPLSERVVAGDPRAMARAISLIENATPEAADLVRAIFPATGRAYLVGVTGPPGAGKSTLVDRLIAGFRAAGRTVGVIAVDPTSPFTGGAILGDRVRMQAHAGDAGVFIRSMATRGNLGGLARATADAALVLDAAGRDLVIIETVGVGQDEVDVVRTADVSVVVLVPGSGDEVQALKAGIMEIADLFVVNKADREGADRMVASVEAMLSLMTYAAPAWRPPIVRTVATTGAGLDELLAAIERFRAHTAATQPVRRRVRAEYRLRELIAQRFLDRVEREVLEPDEIPHLLDRIAARELDLYTAVDGVLARALAGGGREGGPQGARETARLDHIGIAVADIDRAIAFYRDSLGLEVQTVEEVRTEHVRAHFVPAGPVALELLEATADESPIARFVSRRGPGLHHITLRVADIHAAIERLEARGVRVIGESPRPGAHGSLVAFIHPDSTQGVLVELTQA